MSVNRLQPEEPEVCFICIRKGEHRYLFFYCPEDEEETVIWRSRSEAMAIAQAEQFMNSDEYNFTPQDFQTLVESIEQLR